MRLAPCITHEREPPAIARGSFFASWFSLLVSLSRPFHRRWSGPTTQVAHWSGPRVHFCVLHMAHLQN